MASTTEIANLAIRHLGTGKVITDLETENTVEAATCRAFFETARDKVLRDFGWPFATKIEALGLIQEDPNDEWAYEYRYPADCLSFRRILSGNRNPSRSGKVAYRVAQDATGRTILTDMAEAVGEWTVREEDPELYPPDFVLALSFLLAYYIAPTIAGREQRDLVREMLQSYGMHIAHAAANAANEEQPEQPPDDEFITERG